MWKKIGYKFYQHIDKTNHPIARYFTKGQFIESYLKGTGWYASLRGTSEPWYGPYKTLKEAKAIAVLL